MDNSHSERLNQLAATAAAGAAEMDNVGNSGIDLTLKLGLPKFNHQSQALYGRFPAASMAPNHLADLTFAGPNTQGMNQLETVNQEAMAQGQQQSLTGSQYAWPPSDQTASNVHNMNYANAFNHSGPSRGLPSYTTNFFNSFAPTHQQQQLPASSPLPTNNYTLLDVPPRRTARELGSSSSASGSGRRGGNRRQRGGNYNDPNKRCTNYNCNTNNTPMWRRGPLGPKTLCNACGIKYRKEEEKRRAKES